jgi:DNA-binding transcriptional LysR family regulator
MIDWDDYRFILAIARAPTMRAAAPALGVTHSTVSRRLAMISDRFGGPVFDKITSGYRATKIGSDLVTAAEQMEEIVLESGRKNRAFETRLSGPITLSIPVALGQYLLLEEIAKFDEQHKDISLTVQSSYQFADLDRSEADIVVRGVDDPPEHYVGRRLFPYALCEYCRFDYLEKTTQEDRRWLAAKVNGKAPDWISSSAFPDAPVGLSIDDIELRNKAALDGYGMIRTACYIADPDPQFIRLPGSKPTFVQDLWVLTHPDLKNTPRIKELMRFIVQALLTRKDLIEGRSV